MRFNARALVDPGIRHHAVGADAGAVAQDDFPFQDHAHVEEHVPARLHVGPDLDTFGIRNPYARLHQFAGSPAAKQASGFGELGRAVDAQCFVRPTGPDRAHGRSFGKCDINRVGKVDFLL